MAVSPVESQTEGQTDNHPLLMDHLENVGRHEHAIDIPRANAASSSTSHRDNHDGSEQLHYDGGPSTGVPPLSGSSSETAAVTNSRNASITRRGDNNGRRHRSPLNSGFWISIEVLVNVSQVVAAVSVLSVSRNEHPRTPLFEWVIGYTIGCISALPHLYWRYIHRNHPGSEQEPARQNTSQNEANSYTVISSANASQVVDGTSTTGVSRNNMRTASPRVHALVDHFKMTLDCFFAVWFVVGNVWMFGGRSSVHDAPKLYRLCIVFLTFSCIGYAMPFILCAMICFCLPCVISIMGFREDLNQNRGATAEVIDALATYKFKLKKVHNGNGEGSNDGGGILAAGTDKERIISAEDAVCCICLAKYADNDNLRELPCTHFFHMECVDKWLKINALCPLCKAEIGGGVASAPAIGFARRHSDNRVGDGIESQQ